MLAVMVSFHMPQCIIKEHQFSYVGGQFYDMLKYHHKGMQSKLNLIGKLLLVSIWLKKINSSEYSDFHFALNSDYLHSVLSTSLNFLCF